VPVFDTQLGVSAESTWGTFVVPARHFDFNSESFQGRYERVKSNGIRAGRFVQSDGNYQPVAMGAGGTLEWEPLTKGFGLWLSNMLGTVSLGSPSGGFTLQTHTPGALGGKSLSIELLRPYVTAATGTNIYRYSGGKIKTWSLAAEQGGLLRASVDMDFRAEVASAVLTTAVYPSSTEPFVWTAGAVTIGGTSTPFMGFELTGDNMLSTERFKIQASGLKDEQVEMAYRQYGIKISGVDYQNQTHFNRIAAATAANAQAAIVLTFTGITNATRALTITIASAVARAGNPNVNNGALVITQDLDFEIMQAAAGTAAISAAYNSEDAAA